jgi:hypothetical protein
MMMMMMMMRFHHSKGNSLTRVNRPLGGVALDVRDAGVGEGAVVGKQHHRRRVTSQQGTQGGRVRGHCRAIMTSVCNGWWGDGYMPEWVVYARVRLLERSTTGADDDDYDDDREASRILVTSQQGTQGGRVRGHCRPPPPPRKTSAFVMGGGTKKMMVIMMMKMMKMMTMIMMMMMMMPCCVRFRTWPTFEADGMMKMKLMMMMV